MTSDDSSIKPDVSCTGERVDEPPSKGWYSGLVDGIDFDNGEGTTSIGGRGGASAVSYTHLTLPTKRIV